MSYLQDFQSQISARDYPAFLRLWEEYCKSDEIDGEELRKILENVRKSEFASAFGKYVDKILTLWELLPESEHRHVSFRLIVDLVTTSNDALRQLTWNYLKERFKDRPDFADKLRLVSLRTKDQIQGAVSQFELLMHMGKGKFVFHTGGWGVGEIMDVSLVREELAVEFENVPGQKVLSFTSAFKTLIPIPDDHFLAQRFNNPDLLEQKAKENPVEVLRILLRDLGPKTAAEVKLELEELVIPEAEWTRWWQGARAKIKKDTMIETPEDLRGHFVLRGSAVSHGERLKKLLDQKIGSKALVQTLYTFLRDFPEAIKEDGLAFSVQTKLTDALTEAEITEADALSIRFLINELGMEKGSEAVHDMIRQTKSLEALVQSIEIGALKKKALIAARAVRSDWKEVFLRLLFTVSQNPLRDYILSELLAPETEADLKKKLEDLWVHPSRYPDLFLWYFQKVVAGEKVPFANPEGRSRFFEAFFILFSHLEETGTHRDLLKKLHTILTDDRYLIVRKIMQETTVTAVQEILLLATKCHSLDDHDIKILHSLAEVAHPSLGKGKKKDSSSSDLESLWTTQEGFVKVKKRMEEIASVETVANAREIEVARSHGDLRENAEFKAALERRSRLQNELKLLSDQVNRARIITEPDISTDAVGVGTIVECENPQGRSVTYTLLGPWDADPDKSIISMQSKLARTMTGLHVGDKFQFQGEEFTIKRIGSYLNSK
jgi:transcription elongation factor GreA-like protein/transcription elongation GreA/GreB family factor